MGSVGDDSRTNARVVQAIIRLGARAAGEVYPEWISRPVGDSEGSGGSQLGRVALRDEVSDSIDLDDDDLGAREGRAAGRLAARGMGRHEAVLSTAEQLQVHERGMLAAAELIRVQTATADDPDGTSRARIWTMISKPAPNSSGTGAPLGAF